MLQQQPVGLVLVVGRPGHLARGHERGQPALLARRREDLDVEVRQRQHHPHTVLLAQALERRNVVRVVDQRHRGAYVGGVLRGRERRGVCDERLGEASEAGDDVVALACTGEQDGRRAHWSPSQPPAAPL